jgi:metal-responsive CopG/Arc/MetJ family transcriptional regulator
MTEHTVTIPDQVLAELMPMLEQEGKDIGDLVAEALRRYLWEARERKIDQEMTAYRAMHGELKQRFLGAYVAIHIGELVDHDTDRSALSSRVRRKYGNVVVLILPVQDEPEREFLMLSPRLERGA